MEKIEQIQEILHFWFEETTSAEKYTKDADFDALILSKYEPVYRSIVESRAEGWTDTPEGSLAAIVVLDQFSRNMFRDDKQSFVADNLALEIAVEMVKSAQDKDIALDRRMAVYMPYMHSESKDVHVESLRIFKVLAEESGDMSGVEYEMKHKAIIDKFGRYPHRNEVLGRTSTSEEEEFNKEHGGF